MCTVFRVPDAQIPSTPEVGPVPTGEMLWPDSEKGPWRMSFEWAIVDGRQEVVGIRLSSLPSSDTSERLHTEAEPVVLTTDWLRRLTDGRAPSFASIVGETKKQLAEDFLPLWGAMEPHRRAELALRAERLKGGRARTGRPPLPRSHYQEVALLYEKAYRQGSTAPTKYVADQMNVSHSTAANWVAKARKLGLLAPTTRGRPGGVFSSHAEEMLEALRECLEEAGPVPHWTVWLNNPDNHPRFRAAVEKRLGKELTERYLGEGVLGVVIVDESDEGTEEE